MKVNTCIKCGKDFWTKDTGENICFTCYKQSQEDVVVMPEVQVYVSPEIVERDNSGYVYIVKSGSYYKIGMTSRESGRLNELRGLFPVLKLINQFACNDRSKVESYLHKKYKKQQVKREWYKLSKEDVEWLKSLTDNSLDEVVTATQTRNESRAR